jgi:hypothetical protein
MPGPTLFVGGSRRKLPEAPSSTLAKERRPATDVPFGMALEGLTAADQPYQG